MGPGCLTGSKGVSGARDPGVRILQQAHIRGLIDVLQLRRSVGTVHRHRSSAPGAARVQRRRIPSKNKLIEPRNVSRFWKYNRPRDVAFKETARSKPTNGQSGTRAALIGVEIAERQEKKKPGLFDFPSTQIRTDVRLCALEIHPTLRQWRLEGPPRWLARQNRCLLLDTDEIL
ncbi:MAG: hypothetical protein BJ554DRAFT_1051 [Olpidium bornovanus]|uniref:Uncharacterized protein n=1 Tax=Olpidium bornovanus TaxID=278681 RepID=A0A8H8DHE7_9FUNG|nr:MAG: hypothetical protein BJ554DRAFT_1051 [Olpidium bornovanus]